MERQGNLFSRLRQTKVIGEKRPIQERGIHACPALARWRKITTRSPRICPWEICPMGHRYIVIQGAHVDVVYGKWPGEAGSRSRQKGCLPQPLLRRCTGAAAFGANILLCLDSKIHSALVVCLADLRVKRVFLCSCCCPIATIDRSGRKSSKLC